MSARRPADKSADDSLRRQALSELCELYWQPIYCFLRRQGHSPDDAIDLCQGFLLKLLELGDVGAPEQERGRFRTYLLGALKHFVSDERERANARKRGGGVTVLSIDSTMAESQLALTPADHRTPETIYVRQWALTLLDGAREALAARYAADDAAAVYQRLSPHLVGSDSPETYAESARALGVSEDAVKMAVSRMRRRFREALREKVRETVADESDIDDEIKFLISALQG